MGEDTGNASNYTFEVFTSTHGSQLTAGGVPEHLWPSLYQKLLQETFDAGEYFQIICEEGSSGTEWSVRSINDISANDQNCCWLIDHAFTFRLSEARAALEANPLLVDRIKGLIDIEDEEDGEDDSFEEGDVSKDEETVGDAGQKTEENKPENSTEQKTEESKPENSSLGVDTGDVESVSGGAGDTSFSVVDRILKQMWKRIQTYTVRFKTAVDEDAMPMWYIMDEFGVRIAHADYPNTKVVPLFFAPRGIAYNILFLTQDVMAGDSITRDFLDVPLAKERPEWRELMLIPWTEVLPENLSLKREPVPEKFFLSGRQTEYVPVEEAEKVPRKRWNGEKISIFADDIQLVEHLKNVKYELVDDWRNADVIWNMRHCYQFNDLREKNPSGLVNQFPYECCLNVKDLLSAILSETNEGRGPAWFQVSYNLLTELPQFVAAYADCSKRGSDNVWIVKPWNLARGLDMHVTDHLPTILRLTESGPKLACKYISRPLLFPRSDNGNRVKFDLRYVVFVNEFRPVKAYVYNKFWIRFAINEFSMSNFDDMETHFTVFNYADDSKILQMECGDFITHLEKAYPMVKWSVEQTKINQSIMDMLQLASRNDAPRGVAANSQSRAMYGVDVMLQWKDDEEKELQPTILECNFMPDCTRACQYYPNFADTVFHTLFLDHIDDGQVTAL